MPMLDRTASIPRQAYPDLARVGGALFRAAQREASAGLATSQFDRVSLSGALGTKIPSKYKVTARASSGRASEKIHSENMVDEKGTLSFRFSNANMTAADYGTLRQNTTDHGGATSFGGSRRFATSSTADICPMAAKAVGK